MSTTASNLSRVPLTRRKSSLCPTSVFHFISTVSVTNTFAFQWSRLKALSGEFDLIFVDANKDGYEGYIKTILEQKLLSPNGIILCDNGKHDNESHPLAFHEICS